MKQNGMTGAGPMARNLGLFFAAILLIVFSVVAGQYPDRNNPYVPALSSQYYYEKSRLLMHNISAKFDGEMLVAVLRAELPVLSGAGEAGQGTAERPNLLNKCLNLLAGVKLEDPLSYLKAAVPMMDVTPVTADSFDETGFAEVSEPARQEIPAANEAPPAAAVKNTIRSEAPLIALYNTHTSETFELTDGVAHLKGKAGGVTLVAREIQRVIQEQYGIATVYSPVIHDLSFNKSYAMSEKTVSQLLKDNPQLEMLFDIHRDGSLTREQSLTTIGGQKVARILIVVGTDARADHPRWRENLELARKIAAKMDLMYPGLSRGVSVKQGRYNQQYSTKALLVEIGSAKNSTAEAAAAGRLFANVLVAVLNDMKAGS